MELSNLHYAASIGDVAKVRKLIASGSPVSRFEDGHTPLHLAASNGHLDVVKALIEAGADVNAHDANSIGDTPLGYVAGDCSLEIATELVDAGADPTIRGCMQLCALDRAKDRKRGDGPAIYRLMLSVTKNRPPGHRPA